MTTKPNYPSLDRRGNPKYINRCTVNFTDDMQKALEWACEMRIAKYAHVIRRWMIRGAIYEGYMQKPQPPLDTFDPAHEKWGEIFGQPH